ncbi:MAG: hypothetical protein PHV37_10080 [Candidatus Gastranaerophilales bacterium]|nr:hypothetical protein [Candidatus Gastranaerophilales bacterium]
MKKIIALLVVFGFVFCLANVDSVLAARKSKTADTGISQEEVTTLSGNLDKLTQKLYAGSLFSPQENAQIMQIKMKLDDQMLVASDPMYAPLYYKLGKLLKARGYKDDAVECFQTVLENFADTALAPKALNELKAMGVQI